MSYTEKTVSTEEIYKGKIIRVRKDTVELCNGRQAVREVVEHPGGVCVVAKTANGKILMVRQYRKPFETEMWELPAGKLEYGEDHCEGGRRELEEETGYIAGGFEYLGNFYVSPGFCDEKIHIYYADNLKKTCMNPDEDEFIDAAEFTYGELEDMIKKGLLHDAKTVIGILMCRDKFGV